ncbi:MAG TPA: hypothetical protein VKZ58_11540 [Longimicrobiales bacterium]|nr:hypothetical protein [Longimicrobiales bacterium]
MSEAVAIRRAEQLRAHYRSMYRRGFLASVLVHLLFFLIFLGERVPPSPFAAAGPRTGDDRAAAGGGLKAIAIQVPPTPQEIPRPPEPVLSPDALITMDEIPMPEPERVTFSEFEGMGGQDKGPEAGPGREGGTGTGDGGTAMEGRFRVVPPAPRGMILPPSDRPSSVRGKSIAVWVFVNEAGRVVADSTRLQPGSGDPRFDARIKQQAAEWVFEPARRGGRPVAEWFRYVISL